MSIIHPYDTRDDPPSLRFNVRISTLGHTESIPYLGKVDTGADLTKVPDILKSQLEPLMQMGEKVFRYGNKTTETHPTYLATIHLNGFSLDAEVYFRDAEYILIGRNVLNQIRLCADGRNFTFSENAPTPPSTAPTPPQSPQ